MRCFSPCRHSPLKRKRGTGAEGRRVAMSDRATNGLGTLIVLPVVLLAANV